jgi:hypothetical protein
VPKPLDIDMVTSHLMRSQLLLVMCLFIPFAFFR